MIGNIVRRVLGLIRDEASEDRNADDLGSEAASDIQSLAPSAPPPHPPRQATLPIRPPPSVSTGLQVSKSMFNLLSVADPGDSPMTGASTPLSQAQPASVHTLRSEVMDGIEEIMDEIGQADDQIASFADIQIHPGDFVLAYQPSRTVEKFLIKAASKRRFTVIIAGLTSPAHGPGEAPYATLRKKLNGAGVNTINLASNGLMAYIPRVNKVIFGAKAVYQNGGLLVDSGSCIAAQAAHEYLKPVIVLSPVYKFCPEDPSDEVSRGDLGSPSSYVSYANGPEVDALDVENTVTDYIPPELIDVYLTNLYVANNYAIRMIVPLTSAAGVLKPGTIWPVSSRTTIKPRISAFRCSLANRKAEDVTTPACFQAATENAAAPCSRPCSSNPDQSHLCTRGPVNDKVFSNQCDSIMGRVSHAGLRGTRMRGTKRKTQRRGRCQPSLSGSPSLKVLDQWPGK